jgi:hypothetical protein
VSAISSFDFDILFILFSWASFCLLVDDLDFFVPRTIQIVYQSVDLPIYRVDLTLEYGFIVGGLSRFQPFTQAQYLLNQIYYLNVAGFVEELYAELGFIVGRVSIGFDILLEAINEAGYLFEGFFHCSP